MEQAAGQAVQTAAVALQVLVLTAQVLSEHSRREVAQRANAPAVPPQQQPAPAPLRQPADPDHERYAHIVRATVQPPGVAEAMVNAPQWPQLADELKKLERAGVNVHQFLSDAAPMISRMDADLRAGSTTPGVTTSAAAATPRDPWAPPPGQERDEPGVIQRFTQWVKEAVSKLWQKITGREETSALGERSRELARLGIGSQENSRLVVVARESLADEGMLNQMVTSRAWPGIASQIRALEEAGHNPREALAGVPARIQQAAAAGIKLTPAEAARGLLTDQAKTPVPARVPTPTAAPAAATTPPAPAATTASTPTTEPSPHVRAFMSPLEPERAGTPDRAAAAKAQSTTATPGATPAPGPQAAPTAPTMPTNPTRTHSR